MNPSRSQNNRSISSATLILAIALGLFLAGTGGLLHGQTETGAILSDESHVNHQGMRFLPVPATHVLAGESEVTVAQYRSFLEATGHSAPKPPHFAQEPDHPAVGIGVQDAQAFCDWLTETERSKGLIAAKERYRLPRREEWDLIVGLIEPFEDRSTLDQEIRNKTFYPWGMEWPPRPGAGNFASEQLDGYEDDYAFTAPVKSFEPNRLGIYDLAGNAWEWCESDTISGTPQWVLRGGSWIYFIPESLLASYEYRVPDGLVASSFGFRCVFEDPERAVEVTRAMMAARRSEEEEARSKFMTKTDERAEMTPEEAAAARRELLEKELMAAADETDVGGERRRLLSGIGGDDPTATAGDTSGSRFRSRPENYVAQSGVAFENSLGLRFLPVDGLTVLFGATEVRVSDYAKFLLENPGKAVPTPSFRQGDEHPVVQVSWYDAVAFCEWMTQRERREGWISGGQRYRLPSDAEWSVAAGLTGESGATPEERAGRSSQVFPWGAQWPPPMRTVNIDALKIDQYEDRNVYTADVAKVPESPAGIFGLAGNVAEWCLDNWNDQGAAKTIRGGSWMTNRREELVTSFRRKAPPETVLINIGFRCVLETD